MTRATPAPVYLAASSHPGTLQALARRAHASIGERPARVAVSHAASGGAHPRASSFLEGLFGGAQVTRFTVAGEKHAMPPDEARAVVLGADLIFLGGGDPVLGARLLVDAGADGWLRDARARGVPCMGISAGSMMLGAWWADWPEDPLEGAHHDGGELVSCTRVVGDLVIDCHAEEDDWNELRLVRAMLRQRLEDAAPLPRLIGIPTEAGLIVNPDGSLEPIGGAPFEL
jgi:cyanophycinase-like exopeptidase